MESPFTAEEVKLIALEEGLRSACELDQLRLRMLNEAVDWICELTEMNKTEVRRDLAYNLGNRVYRNINTIKAAKEYLSTVPAVD